MPLTVSARPTRRGPIALALLALVALVIPGAVWAAKPPPAPNVDIQILNVSDWHANLDPASANGGAWNISARWQADRAAFAGPTLTLTAGDDFGAAPPLSGFFDEIPSIQAQRLMGIQVNTFGNHNFDRGLTHLQQMVDLAAAPSTGNAGAHPGQPFHYVATNLANLAGNLTGVDRIAYFTLGGVKVAVLGIVNEEAPTLVSVGNFGTIQITDGVAATKAAAREARKNGAKAVIVITHKGVTDAGAGTGPLTDFVNALPGGLVDVVIGDHTNIKYSGTGALNGILFHENASFGNTYAKTFLTVKPGNGPGVIAKSMTFVDPVAPNPGLRASVPGGIVDLCPVTGFCDQNIVTMLAPWRVQLAAALDGPIGTTVTPFDRGSNIERRQEVPLGDLLADSLTANYGVQIGLYTGGSIRSQFPACGYKPVDTSLNRRNWDDNASTNPKHVTLVTCTGGYASGTPLDLVTGDVYTVLPFGNNIVTRTVTGDQLWRLLENSVSHCPTNYDPNNDDVTCDGRFPQVSGIKFTFDKSVASGCSGAETKATWVCASSGGRITSVTLMDGSPDGTPILADSTTYTFATTDFTNNGGDSYFMLADGQGTSRDRDANSFLAYLQSIGSDLDPADYPQNRITICPCP
ncbi:MAG TPA: 5'-nucleotidase C-terminal domain-containing protein [Candidatus Limnocylindrales bacterium]|nr:5'-nucleotidase C-terminal domain-containing protein [Candidatus Limnocylindrales bacterium]